ncbi:hypothetical protein DM02DRAFT_175622 [Periconia macrospinosa]|uniref:Uncharacterized protein n=1 Tax=Periconia macrospinosa TaxID=97972 RepID=A0A2V1D9N2_9PLEO|nr:hypothetical protein DM02DRAFT_175622 [Periconia macrospinosa]
MGEVSVSVGYPQPCSELHGFCAVALFAMEVEVQSSMRAWISWGAREQIEPHACSLDLLVIWAWRVDGAKVRDTKVQLGPCSGSVSSNEGSERFQTTALLCLAGIYGRRFGGVVDLSRAAHRRARSGSRWKRARQEAQQLKTGDDGGGRW